MEDVGHGLSWGALGAFLHQIEPDSAIAEELHPDIAEWSTTFKTNVLLADIFDILARFASLMVFKGTGKKAPKIDEYPRSWRKKENAFKTVMTGNEWLNLLEGGEDNAG